VDEGGKVIATFNDTDVATVSGSTITVSEIEKEGYGIYSFIKSETGGSACPDTPKAGPATVRLTAADFADPGKGTVQLCAYNKPKGEATAKVTLTFIEAKDGVATWRLQPESPADLYVWDESADECLELNGAACGDIGKGSNGKFYGDQKGQYFLITQSYKQDGESCSVTHTAQYSRPETPGERETLTGTYQCSGAPTLGTWGMLIAFVGAVGAAWYVRRVRA